MRSPLLWLALLCHSCLATAYVFLTPAFEGPDENSHYEYAWSLANNGHLPLSPGLATERGLPQTEGAVLAHHPPLYYALLAACLVVSGDTDTVFGPILNPDFGQPVAAGTHLRFVHGGDERAPRARAARVLLDLRLVSVALGLLSLLCVRALARACCPERPVLGDVAALLTACLPMWSFLHGVLNSDNLAILMATATLLALVRFVRSEAPTWRGAASIGLLLGLALLAKLTTLFLAPLAAVAFTLVAAREIRAGRGRRALLPAGVALAVAALVCGWWFVRNLQLYGDPLAMRVHDAAFPGIAPQYVWPFFWNGFLPQVFASLLGCFGWFTLPPPRALVAAGGVAAALAGLGLMRLALDRPRAPMPRPLWLLFGTCALVFAATAHFNTKVPQPQGRLLLVAVGPAAVLFATGLLRAGAMLRVARQARWFAALPPLVAGAVLVAWFRPAFDPALAPAPAHHASLVGDIVSGTTQPAIGWLEPAAGSTLAAPPRLRWRAAEPAPGAIYSLYAYDARGRVWLATHEWSHGEILLQGGEAVLPEGAWALLPKDRDVFLELRAVPDWRAGERLGQMPVSTALRCRRE
ncbi:MAG TPA: DUF2142 domain-containing protein [Planctomycetota bacterium]|nr:DUF2142 domain-containing protein [Planctomycetota bacterium]